MHAERCFLVMVPWVCIRCHVGIGSARESRQIQHSAGFFAVVCIISLVRCCIFVSFLVVSHLWQLLGACELDSESGNLEAAQAMPQSMQNASASSLRYPTPIQVVNATNEVPKAECTTTQSDAKNRTDDQNQPNCHRPMKLIISRRLF